MAKYGATHAHPGITGLVFVVNFMLICSSRNAQAQVEPQPPSPNFRQTPYEEAETSEAKSITASSALFLRGNVVGTWVAQGPAPMTDGQVESLSPDDQVAGAIHAVVAHPTDANILYVGAVNGGVWRTMNGTAASPTWTPLTDSEKSLSIGALEMDPGNPMILLAGIGRFSSFGGDPPFQVAGGPLSGLLRTKDGGNTWISITHPLLVNEHISSVASRGTTLLAGANDFRFGGGVGGLFRSTDTGATWEQVSGGPGTGLPAGTVDDLGGDPSDKSRLYVALQGDGVYRTDDTGATWTQVSNNDPTFNMAMVSSTNTRIAVAGDTRVFVLVTSGRNPVTYIGFSDDLGGTWTQMDIPGTAETALQGRDQLMSMVVDPSNSDIVYVAGITQVGPFLNSVGAATFSAHMFRGDVTRARGLTGTVSSQWDHLTHATGNALMPNGGTANTSAPHADSREMTFDAGGNLIEVNDAGVVRRTSPGSNTGDWFSINGNLQVTELHTIAYDSNFDILIGGTQDTASGEQDGAGSTEWETVGSGDGGKVVIDDSTPGVSVRYFSNQFFNQFRRRTTGVGDAFPNLAGGVPALVPGRTGNVQFYTPLEINVVDPMRLLIGASNNVYESMDQGDNVSTVPDGGANVQANSDAAMVYGHPNNAELIYVGFGTQVFVRTTAGGNLTQTTAAFPGGMVFGIAVDPADENIAYVIGNTSVYQTDDGGASWTDITGDITQGGAGTFRSIAYLPSGTTDKIAVGTNAGVYITFEDDLGTWFLLGSGVPNAPVWDLEYDSTDDVLVAGTLGRGAWLISSVSNLNTINLPPDISNATPSLDELWPPNHEFVPISIEGVTDPDGDPVTITVDAICQDEPLDTIGDGNFAPDASGVGTATAHLRAERSGAPRVPGDGRVYHIFFTADDGNGGICTGSVTVCVPHEQEPEHVCVDGGPVYNSTAGSMTGYALGWIGTTDSAGSLCAGFSSTPEQTRVLPGESGTLTVRGDLNQSYALFTSIGASRHLFLPGISNALLLDEPVFPLRVGVLGHPASVLSCPDGPNGVDTIPLTLPTWMPPDLRFNVQAVVGVTVDSGSPIPPLFFTRAITFTLGGVADEEGKQRSSWR